jgi:hypothetical protein
MVTHIYCYVWQAVLVDLFVEEKARSHDCVVAAALVAA